MGILSGVVSYLLGLIINLLDVAITGFLGALGFNLDIFESYFPAARDYYDVITGFAVGLLFILFIFQVFKNFGVALDMEVEDPLKMLGKTGLFFGMIMYSHSIAELIIQLLTDPYHIFLDTYSATFEFSLLDLLWKLLSGVFTNGFTSVVYIIMLIVLGWQFLKFVVEIVERYIVFYFILYCAPVVYATGAFKSTAQIFKSWTRMVASQGMLLLLNVWSIKLFISFMQIFASGSNDMIFTFLLGYAFLKFSQKADTLLRILGLNTASTGEVVRSIGSTIGGIAQSVRTMGGIASKALSGGQRDAGSTRSTSSPGGTNRGGQSGSEESNSVGPMGGNPQGGTGGNQFGAGGSVSGVTDDVRGAARDSYVNGALSDAKAQMNRNTPDSGVSVTNRHDGQSPDGQEAASDKEQDGIRMSRQGDGAQRSHSSISGDTREKLAHLAHGMPHNQYDPVKKSFSGGGFQEFTGENANIIGSTQLPPAEGFKQSQVKMPDGSFATMYRNDDTGESHLVQFGSVDNGVIQGTISSIDGETGKMGDNMAFKAVHESVPGAASFSSHASPMSDGGAGAYYVATGGDHSFFQAGTFRAAAPISSDSPTAAAAPTSSWSNTVGPGSTQTVHSAPAASSAYTPGSAVSKMAGGGVEQSTPGDRSDFDTGSTSIMRDIHRKQAETIDSSDTMSGQSSYESTPGVGGGMGHIPRNPAYPKDADSFGGAATAHPFGKGAETPPINSGMAQSSTLHEKEPHNKPI